MIVVDTSVWIEHFRSGSVLLAELLEAERVAIHPFVIGELACGNIRNRSSVLTELERLPQVIAADHGEAMTLLNERDLAGTGLGWIDVNLLASAVMDDSIEGLFSHDSRLSAAASCLGLKTVLH